jgi:hypothetical protein
MTDGALHVTKSYEHQVQEQIDQYRDTENMHDLPAVYHLWSSDYTRPGLTRIFEVSDINPSYVEAFITAANDSLHHMADLEGIFLTAFDKLTDRCIFVTSNTIGGNGHMRSPEARLFVDFLWAFMSHGQCNNIILRRSARRFICQYCSSESVEGIRSQGILPLSLGQGLKAWKFLGFGGIIDDFLDRCFGPNFNVDDADDAFLVRRVGLLNEILMDASLVKPTMMLPISSSIRWRKSTTATARRRLLFATRLGLPAPLRTSSATRLIRTLYSNYGRPRRSVPNRQLESTPVPSTRTAQKLLTPTKERGISL